MLPAKERMNGLLSKWLHLLSAERTNARLDAADSQRHDKYSENKVATSKLLQVTMSFSKQV